MQLSKLSICFYFLILSFLIGYTLSQNNETCEYKKSHCLSLAKDAFKKYPNYRDKRTPDLIKLFGYPVEEHVITTEDGYILTVQRIPYSNISAPSSSKIPVFCMHGLFSSSAQWFWQPTKRALVFMLADAGYDVWIGNARGTSYSRKHTSLPVNDKRDLRYWNFTVDEIGKYDVPAWINYVTNYTAQPSLYWIGHSLGAGEILTGLIFNPELNLKVRTVFGLAPAIYLGNASNQVLGPVTRIYSKFKFQQVANKVGTGRVVPSVAGLLLQPVVNLCRISWIDCGLCSNLVYLIFGFSCQLDLTTLPGLAAHFPDDMSTKFFSHTSQWSVTGEFKKYDYGHKNLNQKHYGQDTPPFYDWTKVDVPFVLYYGSIDNLVVGKDVKKTAAALGSNAKEVNEIQGFNHLDFIAGIDADKFIYNKIIEIMNIHKYDKVDV